MEHEVSLPHSQELSTLSYAVPDQSNPDEGNNIKIDKLAVYRLK
jgi:hypothetical protein